MPQRQRAILSRANISDAAGLAIAALYTFAGQAHFTSRFTPGFAAKVDEMTPNTHQALWFLYLDYQRLKWVLGGLDLIAAALLWRKTTRRTGLAMAIVGFTGGLYGQWFSGGDLEQVIALLSLAVVGYFTAPTSND